MPKTDEESNEAFGLLDELLKELGREEALRRELARSLLKLPLKEVEPEELRKAARRERLVQQPRRTTCLRPNHSSSEPRPREVTQWKTGGIQGQPSFASKRPSNKSKRFTKMALIESALTKLIQNAQELIEETQIGK